jgi:hypothetical protein
MSTSKEAIAAAEKIFEPLPCSKEKAIPIIQSAIEQDREQNREWAQSLTDLCNEPWMRTLLQSRAAQPQRGPDEVIEIDEHGKVHPEGALDWMKPQPQRSEQYPDRIGLDRDRRDRGVSPRPTVGEQPRFNLETLEGRKAAWDWMQKKFGNPVVVTKGGVPFEDQAEGIRQFKAAALRSEQPQEFLAFVHKTLHEFNGTECRKDGGWCDARDHADAIYDAHNAALAKHDEELLEENNKWWREQTSSERLLKLTKLLQEASAIMRRHQASSFADVIDEVLAQ